VPEFEIVHPVAADELRDWLVPLATGLLSTTHGDDFDDRVARRTPRWAPERAWGVRAGGRWVATLATEARRLTVPAGRTGTHDVDVDALTLVSVSATHRRQGLLRRMIGRSLQAAVERGDPLGILIAAEWPIYGRYGYAAATDLARYRLRPRRPLPLLPAPPAGAVRMIDVAELAELAGPLFEAARRARPGQVDRAGTWWERRLGTDGRAPMGGHPTWVVHEGPDGVDGLLGWSVTRESDLADSLGALKVDDFVAASDDAYRDLWSYLCGIDLVEEIQLPDRPVDEPIRWLLHDGRALSLQESTDELWVRLLDVARALTLRGYAARDQIVLDVVDDAPGAYAEGRYRLDTTGEAPTCTPTDAAADLRLDQRALAASYLGGRALRAVALGGGVAELTPGAIDRVDALFAVSLAPWTQTGF
jgi:predicted acetyltransferase